MRYRLAAPEAPSSFRAPPAWPGAGDGVRHQPPHVLRADDSYPDSLREELFVGYETEVRSAVEGIREQLSLSADRALSLKRRVAAVAEVWAVRVEELRPRQLKGYGEVR